MKHADIYVNGDKANISAKEPASRINEALGKLVAMQYNKLTTWRQLRSFQILQRYSMATMDSFLSLEPAIPHLRNNRDTGRSDSGDQLEQCKTYEDFSEIPAR